jgi:uncharacterized protein (TIGR01244 family)
MKDPIQVSDRLFSGDQPTEEDLERLAKAGFRSVINLRKPGEPNQSITPEAEQGYAEANGLNYASVPVSIAELQPEHVTRLSSTIAELPSPIYLHCAVGQRAAALALLCEAAGPGVSGDDLLREAAAKGLSIADKNVVRYVHMMADRAKAACIEAQAVA